MDKQPLVNFGKTLEDRVVGRDGLALLDESADDIDAHRHGSRAVEDGGGHQCAVLGEGVGAVFLVLPLL